MKTTTSAILALLIALTGVLSACAAPGSSNPTPNPTNAWFNAQPWELPDDAVEMRVDKIHDGDSINLTRPNDDWWEKYRIIGIQAPEVEGYKPKECGGDESRDFLKSLLPEGTIVWIQQDISNKDPNGRYLRHVFVQDEETGNYYLLSEIMVLSGHARQRSYKPDDFYDDVLIEAQKLAWEQPNNMWTCDEWKDLIRD